MDTFAISGKILHKESSSGISNLLVELFDIDNWPDPESAAPIILRDSSVPATPAVSPIDSSAALPDITALYKFADRVGSCLTDSAGQFAFEVTAKDFNLPGKNEQKPDLVLVVLGPDEPGMDITKRVLHLARDIRLNAASREAYIIRLSTAILTAREIPVDSQKDARRETATNRVSAYIDEREREKEFNAGVARYHNTELSGQRAARDAFRTNFVKSIAPDPASLPANVVLAADGDSIREKSNETVSNGIARVNEALGDQNAQGVPVNLYLTPDDMSRLNNYFASATGDYVEIPDVDIRDLLFRTNSSENPGTLLIQNNPIANFCSTEGHDVACAREHADGHEPDHTPTAVGTTLPDVSIGNNDIPTYIGRLVSHMPTPDAVLQPDLLRKPADRAAIESAVDEFFLPKGPAEVPAFYDFLALQIAFDHVWKQLFDEAIPNLAFTADNLGRSRLGVDSILTGFRNGLLAIDTSFVVTPLEVPPGIAKLFDVTVEEYNDMSPANRQQLGYIANDIDERSSQLWVFGNGTFKHTCPKIVDLRSIQALTEQGERLIDTVRHDDYYTLHKTLRDLQDRLNSKYEFTVFAADKDYHSVNFGVLNTYRQQWTPLTYQAGKLVKTIPLSPKEERKYSVKNTRNEKRGSKEAKKNNSSITNEQHSTSRVEADIMAKTQSKTNFGLNTEGDFNFNLGAYGGSGKQTTTFGVEASSESSQNRKDFREAVLKAVQEYKEEVSTEVTTEVDTARELTESGTIVNPNDELAVTYLFYELQKRYRLSEQLYRVMPVVLVAQEMPSPDQITPAWVLANDWILNRCLLDDSFRPTLSYLTNNSVGDDFAVRELRRNLRQQRNLVETLRIEFSAASVEAENRYKALESAISSRIDEEHRERTDGAVMDIFDFFGGGGQDPEAAKARELAAKDAQQYAQEKAERAAAALREEVNTLHSLTEAYNKCVQTRLDNETKVKRLLVHIRNNIFYYMQAIWSLEPPDQRYLRLYKVQVPVLELESRTYRVKVHKESADSDIFARFRETGTEKHRAFLHGTLKHSPNGAFDTVPLVEVADINTLLGCEGNYMIFPMNEHNALTEFMAAPYIDSAFGAMDPDELSNVSLDDFSKYICCLHEKMTQDEFDGIKDQLRAWLDKLLASPLRNGDEIVIPTGSLFIESLVDPNTVLEIFKMKHRELDVYKVQEEVRKAGLENLRLAARLLNARLEDPDIEKKIVVAGSGIGVDLDVDNP
ncbi:MAG: hypothetical protein LAO18_10010 [Acidobacteriia bacterium]|nr:hypothetical protein [Terriglobia bacterium]